jgi:hypothetical protein
MEGIMLDKIILFFLSKYSRVASNFNSQNFMQEDSELKQAEFRAINEKFCNYTFFEKKNHLLKRAPPKVQTNF